MSSVGVRGIWIEPYWRPENRGLSAICALICDCQWQNKNAARRSPILYSFVLPGTDWTIVAWTGWHVVHSMDYSFKLVTEPVSSLRMIGASRCLLLWHQLSFLHSITDNIVVPPGHIQMTNSNAMIHYKSSYEVTHGIPPICPPPNGQGQAVDVHWHPNSESTAKTNRAVRTSDNAYK